MLRARPGPNVDALVLPLFTMTVGLRTMLTGSVRRRVSGGGVIREHS